MWKHRNSNSVVVFHFPSVCVLMSISFWPTWRLAVTSRAWQPITRLQLFTKEDTLKKCWLLMRVCMLQSACNYLKWVLSQHLTKQFRMFAQGTVFKELFLGKIWRFYRSSMMNKFQYGILRVNWIISISERWGMKPPTPNPPPPNPSRKMPNDLMQQLEHEN